MTFDQLDIDIRSWRAGNQKVFCPKCHDQRSDKRDKSLSVTLVNGENGMEGPYRCHYCTWGGFATQHEPKGIAPRKDYKLPEEKLTPLSQATIDWFARRGIHETTLQRFKVTESTEWMPASKVIDGKQIPEGKQRVICFNYYRDGKLVNIKYRGKLKNFRLESGAELIFYGLDGIRDAEEVIIVEGEMDALAAYQAGSFFVISVPNGAANGKMKLEYLDNCYHLLANKKSFILATDGDTNGLALREELARRLGKERCKIVDYPEDCKDSNEVLLQHGPDVLKAMYKNARDYPLNGVLTDRQIQDEMAWYYENGFPEGLKLGMPQMDKLVQFRRGMLIIGTGFPNSGKSTWTDFQNIQLAKQGWKFGVVSAEQQPSGIHALMMAQQYIGLSAMKHAKNRMSRAQFEMAQKFIAAHFHFYNLQEVNMGIDNVLEIGRQLVARYGIDCLLIDPYNRLEANGMLTGISERVIAREILQKINTFKRECDCAVMLIAHPKKPEKDRKTKKFDVPTLNDICGSSDFWNMADIGFCAYRDVKGIADMPDPITILIQKVRFFFDGQQGKSELVIDLSTRRYHETGELPLPVLGDDGELLPPEKPKTVYDFPKEATQSILGQWGLNNPQDDIPKEFKNTDSNDVDEVPF